MWTPQRGLIPIVCRGRGKVRSAAGNAVAQGQQGVHKVDVLEEHAGDLRGQLHIGEVPEAPDAQADEPVRQGLGHILGHRQHRHIGPVAGHIFRQLVHGADGDAPDLGVDQRGGHVEGGVHLEAHLLKIEVLQQGVAQVAHADDDEPVAVVDAQNVADLGPQLRHVVAVPLLTELAEAAEILADLGGGDVHLIPQGAGGDAHHAFVVQVIQIPVIPWQPVDDRVRNFLFFHRIFLFLPEQPAVNPLRRGPLHITDWYCTTNTDTCQLF